MPTLEQLSLRLIKEFKTVRLRALQDAPSAFGSTYGKESQLSDEGWREIVDAWNGAGSVCYIGMDGSTPCGIIGGYLDKNDPPRANVVSMWVAPTHRRTGLGTRLMDAVQLWAQTAGAGELRLKVTSNNAIAISFYRQLGYTFTGNTEPYPNDPALTEYEMVKYMLDPWTAHIRALIYGVQFERNPLDGLDWVLRQVVQAGALSATPNQYLVSIRKALASETHLAELIPQGHSEETIRQYLRELEHRIQAIV